MNDDVYSSEDETSWDKNRSSEIPNIKSETNFIYQKLSGKYDKNPTDQLCWSCDHQHHQIPADDLFTQTGG